MRVALMDATYNDKMAKLIRMLSSDCSVAAIGRLLQAGGLRSGRRVHVNPRCSN